MKSVRIPVNLAPGVSHRYYAAVEDSNYDGNYRAFVNLDAPEGFWSFNIEQLRNDIFRVRADGYPVDAIIEVCRCDSFDEYSRKWIVHPVVGNTMDGQYPDAGSW